MKYKNLHLKTLLIFVLFFAFAYLYQLINIYGINHIQSDERSFIEENFEERIPNINNCNLSYYSVNDHISSGGYSNVRYRKIITSDENCFGKVTYTGIAPGTSFNDIDTNQYLEFGVNQKLGYVLWLHEKTFLIFFGTLIFIVVLQIFFEKINFYKYFLIIILLFSIVLFDQHNMFINSSRKYFPNENTKNEIFFQKVDLDIHDD